MENERKKLVSSRPFFNENAMTFPFERESKRQSLVGDTIESERSNLFRPQLRQSVSSRKCFAVTFPAGVCPRQRFSQTECEHVPIIHFYATSPVARCYRFQLGKPRSRYEGAQPLPDDVFFNIEDVHSPKRTVRRPSHPRRSYPSDPLRYRTPLTKRVSAKVSRFFPRDDELSCLVRKVVANPPTLNRFDLIRRSWCAKILR